MKILIVGGTGLISTAVVNEAVSRGFDVTCIVRGKNHGNKLNPKVHLIKGDAFDVEFVRASLEGKYYDAIIDFIRGGTYLIDIAFQSFHDKCKQYIYISTDSVYKLRKDGIYDEKCEQPNPEWSYSYGKSAGEDRLKELCSNSKMKYTIVRPSITYGNTRIPYGYMPGYGFHYTLINRIKAGKPVLTWNNGQNYQTMMRSEDFAVGILGLVGNESAYNEDFGVCGDAYKWDDVLKAVEKATGHKIIREDISLETIIKFHPEKKGEFLIDRAENHIVSNRKLKSVVPDFQVRYSLDEGVKMTLDYYKKNNQIMGNDYEFDGMMDSLIRKNTPPHTHLLKFVNYDNKNYLGNYVSYLYGYYHNNILVKGVNIVKRYIGLIPRIVRKNLKILRLNGIFKAK